MAVCCLVTAPASAQPAGGPQSSPAEVRESAREILSRAEFRHFLRQRERDGKGLFSDDEFGSSPGERRGSGSSESRGRTSPRDSESSERSRRDADQSSSNRSWGRSAGIEAVGSLVGGLMTALAWTVLAVICGLILWLIAQAVMNYERKPTEKGMAEAPAGGVEREPEHAPGELPADIYVAQARRLADEGRYREAVAQLLLGAMSHIERNGLLRYRSGLTCRDYLRAVRPRPPVHTAMQTMVRIYEPLGFGRREATREHFETSLSGYEAGFRNASHTVQD